MKRIISSIVAVVAVFSAAAQSRQIVPVGVAANGAGIEFSEPESSIVVDIRVEHTEVIVGPYARYAQKYLGVRAPLSDKSSWRIAGAAIALQSADALYAPNETEPSSSTSESLFGSSREFPRLPLDRTDSRALTADEAAAEAAAEIFSLRKHRLDLITGEAGENVFGAGLDAALKTIDAYETAYLELFFGKKLTTAETVRMTVRPSSDKFGYLLARFSEKDGLVATTDLSGDMVMLRIDPSGDTSLNYLREATEKDKNPVECRVADLSTCTLFCGTERIASATLPLFEFGRTVRIAR